MKKLTFMIFATAVLTAACSCVREKAGESSSESSGEAVVHLRLITPEGLSGPETRGLTFEQENIITHVYVLAFDNTGAFTAIEEGEVTSSTPGSDEPGYSGEGSFSVTLPASRNSSDTYNLVVFANAWDEVSTTVDSETLLGDDYADIISRINYPFIQKLYDPASADPLVNHIPMWGESGPMVVQPGVSGKTVALTRALARIDVGVGVATKDGNEWSWDGLDVGGETIPFRLGHVYVMRPNNRYAVAHYPYVAEDYPCVPKNTIAHEPDFSETTFNFEATASATGGFSSQDIYVPESDILMGAEGTSGDANHTERMAIVVGGFYNGSPTETYYRLDFAVNKELINVLRNHLYQFSISGVSGPGYGDVQTAYRSEAMNMAVTVIDWNAVDMDDVYFDGTKYIFLGRSANEPLQSHYAVVYRTTGSQDMIKMTTNIPLEEFSFTFDEGETTTDPDNPHIIQNDRFKVELTTIDGSNYFVFTALRDFDSGAPDDTLNSITVTAGRIKFRITIVQEPSSPDDWIDGGNIDKDL